MKTIGLVIFFALFLLGMVGCTEVKETEAASKTEFIRATDTQGFFVTEYEKDGHQYLVFHHAQAISSIHRVDCAGCTKKVEKEK